VTATFDLFKLKMLPAIREVFEDVLGIACYWSGDQVLELCEHRWDATSSGRAAKNGRMLSNLFRAGSRQFSTMAAACSRDLKM